LFDLSKYGSECGSTLGIYRSIYPQNPIIKNNTVE